jgi:hypothetical protein
VALIVATAGGGPQPVRRIGRWRGGDRLWHSSSMILVAIHRP